jgi:hypothetical protein
MYTIQAITKLSYGKDQLQNQNSFLRSKYRIFQDIKEASGFGWDVDILTPTAPETVWDDYIEKHKNAAQFRRRSLANYELLHEIYSGTIATGSYAVNPLPSIRSSHTDQTRDSDDDSGFISVSSNHDLTPSRKRNFSTLSTAEQESSSKSKKKISLNLRQERDNKIEKALTDIATETRHLF